MASLTIDLDKFTEQALYQVSAKNGKDIEHVASVLLSRSLIAERASSKYESDLIRFAKSSFQYNFVSDIESSMRSERVKQFLRMSIKSY